MVSFDGDVLQRFFHLGCVQDFTLSGKIRVMEGKPRKEDQPVSCTVVLLCEEERNRKTE